MKDSRIGRTADTLRRWFGLLCIAWLLGSIAIIAVRWMRPETAIPWTVLTYAWITTLASFVALALYALDKRRAIKEARRIPERVLHGSSFLGGWPGAYLAQQWFRHKTQKTSFRMMFWLIVALHLAAIGYCIYHWWTFRPETTATTHHTPSCSCGRA